MTEPDAPHDEAWFGELYRTWHGDVQRYTRRRVPAHEVDDVVSEVFSTPWRRRDEVDEIGRLWLLGTAHHRVQHERRSGARRRRLLDTVPAQRSVAPASDEVVDVLAALQQLSAADREVLTLVAWEDLTSEEVAAVLGGSVVAARVRLHRARRRLAVLLDRPLRYGFRGRSPRRRRDRRRHPPPPRRRSVRGRPRAERGAPVRDRCHRGFRSATGSLGSNGILRGRAAARGGPTAVACGRRGGGGRARGDGAGGRGRVGAGGATVRGACLVRAGRAGRRRGGAAFQRRGRDVRASRAVGELPVPAGGRRHRGADLPQHRARRGAVHPAPQQERPCRQAVSTPCRRRWRAARCS